MTQEAAQRSTPRKKDEHHKLTDAKKRTDEQQQAVDKADELMKALDEAVEEVETLGSEIAEAEEAEAQAEAERRMREFLERLEDLLGHPCGCGEIQLF